MSDCASTDSFETFKSEELAEGAIKSLSATSTTTDDDFRTAKEMVTSTTDANYYTAEPGPPEGSPDSTLKDAQTLTYLNEVLEQSMVSSSTLEDGSWQDLEQDAVGAWLGPPKMMTEHQQKRTEIIYQLRRNDSGNAICTLRKLGQQEGGFLADPLRRSVWPKLTKVDVIATSPRPDQATMEAHPFYQQVILDVNRSLKRFPPQSGQVMKTSERNCISTFSKPAP